MDQSNVSSPLAHSVEVDYIQCADCSAEDPQWASINRGVLICTDCCSVHRNLGRHVSQVRSLKKGLWDTPQLELVNLLHRSGSNRVWEHALLDPSSTSKFKKKPTPSDPVLPTKELFIKMKYVDELFTLKANGDDSTAEDLNKQLWACVRTSHVDTTLRLIALGADPNYLDLPSGSSPLHVAAKEGQKMQAELLFLYGADPSARNSTDQTPSHIARQEGFIEFAVRLEELCFEVANRLSLFLCGRKPDHTHNQHFLIPELTGSCSTIDLRTMRRQLQQTTNSQFEKVAQDIYDEVDRRETQAAWAILTQGKTMLTGNEQCVAVFLPLNPNFSATRNQLRQKLAKYDVREFATVIIDVLKEIKRRYNGDPLDEALDVPDNNQNMLISSPLPNSCNGDYDEVADFPSRNVARNSATTRSSGQKTRSSDSIGESPDTKFSFDDILELKERLSDSESRLLTLTSTSQQILKLLSGLQSSMDSVRAENANLKNEVCRLSEQLTLVRRLPSPGAVPIPSGNGFDKTTSRLISGAPELGRATRRHGSLTGNAISPYPSIPSGRMSADHHRDHEHFMDMERLHVRDASKETKALNISQEDDYAVVSPLASPPSKIQEVFNDQAFPDNLVRETEKLTVAIRQLLLDAQHKQLLGKAAEHAHKIASLINQIILLIPADQRFGKTEQTISALKDAVMILSAKCNAPVLDTEETCHAAYSVAQGAKMLLMIFHD